MVNISRRDQKKECDRGPDSIADLPVSGFLWSCVVLNNHVSVILVLTSNSPLNTTAARFIPTLLIEWSACPKSQKRKGVLGSYPGIDFQCLASKTRTGPWLPGLPVLTIHPTRSAAAMWTTALQEDANSPRTPRLPSPKYHSQGWGLSFVLKSSSSSPSKPISCTSMENPESWVLQVQLRVTPFTSIFSFLVLSLAAAALSSDPKPEDCEPRDCGNGLNVSYPFWISGLQNSYCGYPGYDVTCDDGAPYVADGVETYVVRDIFYDNMSVIVAELPRRTLCPYPCRNLTFARTLFNVSSVNRELLLYLNCAGRVPAGLSMIECDDNGKGMVSLVAEPPGPAVWNVSLSCESVVIWPFLAYGAVDYRSYGSLLMSNGFLLEWYAPNCSRCRNSVGRCGHDQTSKEFMCVGSDRVHSVSRDGNTTRGDFNYFACSS